MGVLFNEAPSEATMAAVAPYFEAEAENGTGKQHSWKSERFRCLWDVEWCWDDVELELKS